MQDLFMGHIGGMDAFAQGLVVAHELLTASPWEQWRKDRYASFDQGSGRDFAAGRLKLTDLAVLAGKAGEPRQISGGQERYENLLNQYLLTRHGV
jgi:xylose isomerase